MERLLSREPHIANPSVSGASPIQVAGQEAICVRLAPVSVVHAITPRPQGEFDGRFITQLTYNYRSHPDLLSLPSSLFYGGSLVPRAGA